MRRRGDAAKRFTDIALSLVLLLALSPVVVALSLATLLTTGWPIWFRQERSGRHGKPFLILKFRTMSEARDQNGRLLGDEWRLTRFGRLLRALSLDEVLELMNVLVGDMSLVGPRPLFASYWPYYEDWQRRRFVVRPGITGWAQVNGRNATTWEKRFEMDVWYVDNWSMVLDMSIFARTFVAVIQRRGISQGGHATMPVFAPRIER